MPCGPWQGQKEGLLRTEVCLEDLGRKARLEKLGILNAETTLYKIYDFNISTQPSLPIHFSLSCFQ